MSGWDACTLEPNAWLKWIECHPGLAGYIQAVGTVAAIAVALFAPAITSAWENYQYRRARLKHSRKLAGSMRNPVWDAEAEVKRVRARLAEEPVPPDDTVEATLWLRHFHLKLPPHLDLFYQVAADTVPSLTRPFTDAADAVRNYNNALAPYTTGDNAMPPDAWADVHDAILYNLNLVDDAIDQARLIAEKYSK